MNKELAMFTIRALLDRRYEIGQKVSKLNSQIDECSKLGLSEMKTMLQSEADELWDEWKLIPYKIVTIKDECQLK